MLIIFSSSLFMIGFAYLGYPMTLWAWSRWRSKEVLKEAITPSLTLIIAACNEEKRILEKIENTLTIEYPRDRLQVIVTSDGSTDKTNAIVEEYANRGIELLPLPERRGKENAQKEAVARATGEILVFSDVATQIEPDGLKKIVANFADPSVGCVSSVDRVIGREGKPCGEGAYVRYEMWLRDLEARVSSLVGLSGSFFAARREVCADFSADMQSDFRTVLNSMRLGLRGVSDADTIGYYHDIADSKSEFSRKVRTVLRGQTVFFRNLEFLNPVQYGVFGYQYLCHKLLRWLVPVFLILALLSNISLALEGGWWLLLLLLHLVFYGIALWGHLQDAPPGQFWVKIPLYFLTVNAAIMVAWWSFVRGNRMVMWQPTSR